MNFISENELDNWVRGNAQLAQGLIVELIAKLVAASSPKPRERRFPLADSISQHGPDGHVDAIIPFDPFVPEGRSFWEIGTGEDAKKKATADYADLTASVPKDIRQQSTFIFVSPLSGRKDWKHTWKKDGQIAWIEEKKKQNEWKDVRIIDGTKLIDWVHQFIPIDLWLASKTRSLNENQIETLEQKWGLLHSIGEPPPLNAELFLANRADACVKLKELLDGDTTFKLRLTTHFPSEASNFISAYVASLDEETRRDISSRCVIVSGVDAWNNICATNKNLILIAEPSLDLNSDLGIQLIQKAKKANHSVIYSGPKGGTPDPNSVSLPIPRGHHIEEELKKSGYQEERARVLAQQCDGNISTLLRCIQNLSAIPEWVQNTPGSDLVIVSLIGSWNESAAMDKAAIETIAGKSYGEWIKTVRSAASRPATPLFFRDGKWTLISRYEAWYALGSQVSDDHLDAFQKMAIEVLKIDDPKFGLEKDQRHAAQIYGKVLPHSRSFRNALADTIALLGTHSNALTNCTRGKAEAVASSIVRELFRNASWERWATLNQILPLLAEASPSDFLSAIENEALKVACVYDELFKQEGSGITGGTYISGLLWGLETLAWDSRYLSSATRCLGLLAALDPGGQWANRPANSLRSIFLSWYPQTVANFENRLQCIRNLLKEVPPIGWELLLKLLPETHSSSAHTRRPAWRSSIPDDWKFGVSGEEYRRQIEAFSELAVDTSRSDRAKILELIEHIDGLPKAFLERLLEYIRSDEFLRYEEAERAEVWNQLMHVVRRHQRFSDASWALPSEAIAKMIGVADIIAPKNPRLLHQRLFGNDALDIFKENGNYDEQLKELENLKQNAISEIYSNEGLAGVQAFSRMVKNPWMVGRAFGITAPKDADAKILPNGLHSNDSAEAQFISSFIGARFHSIGWPWVNEVLTPEWDLISVGKMLSHLPFTIETWNYAEQRLGKNEDFYWKIAGVNPYQCLDDMKHGVAKLISHGRPNGAIDCLYASVMQKKEIDPNLAAAALLNNLSSSEVTRSMDAYHIVQIIKAIQDDTTFDQKTLFKVEWAYIGLLNEFNDAAPKLIERELASSPEFFCEVIRLVYRSKKEPANQKKELDESQQAIATNAYKLLDNWSRVPGLTSNGELDSSSFQKWLADVKKMSIESGHLEVALLTLGHVLIHTPPDKSGLWIHETVAETLNQSDLQEARNGFRTAIFNSRGVFYFTSGKAEQELSKEYQDQADALESKGYSRFAATIRELADCYKQHADRDAERDPFYDDE